MFKLRVVRDRRFQESSLALNPQDARALGLGHRRQLVVAYGQRQEEVHFEARGDIPFGEGELGHLAAEHLLFHPEVSYELRIVGERLILGPVIGLMMRHTESQLLEEIDHTLPYLLNYPQIGGAAFIFAVDQIRPDQDAIEGYIYNPSPGASPIKKGLFPFPAVWYRRVGFYDTAQYRRVRQSLGQRMVNGYYFTKWEFFLWLRDHPVASQHIALTSLDVSRSQIDHFIDTYGSVYIKPRMGYGGMGVEQATKEGGQYHIHRNFEDNLTLDSKGLDEWIKTYSRHILQQPLDIHRHEGRQCTYRAIVQRQRGGAWDLTGLVGFFGGVDEITGNWSKNGGFLKQGLEALRIQYPNPTKTYKVYEAIRDVCRRVAYAIGKEIDGYVDFGMDIGVDTQGRVWVIEANKRQHFETCAHVGDHQLHHRARAQSLTSCHALAFYG